MSRIENFQPKLTNDSSRDNSTQLQSEGLQMLMSRDDRRGPRSSEPNEMVFDNSIWNGSKQAPENKNKSHQNNLDSESERKNKPIGKDKVTTDEIQKNKIDEISKSKTKIDADREPTMTERKRPPIEEKRGGGNASEKTKHSPVEEKRDGEKTTERKRPPIEEKRDSGNTLENTKHDEKRDGEKTPEKPKHPPVAKKDNREQNEPPQPTHPQERNRNPRDLPAPSWPTKPEHLQTKPIPGVPSKPTSRPSEA